LLKVACRAGYAERVCAEDDSGDGGGGGEVTSCDNRSPAQTWKYIPSRREDGTIIRVYDTRTLYSHARVCVCIHRRRRRRRPYSINTSTPRRRPLISRKAPSVYVFLLLLLLLFPVSSALLRLSPLTRLTAVSVLRSYPAMFPDFRSSARACVRVRISLCLCLSPGHRKRHLFRPGKSTLARASPALHRHITSADNSLIIRGHIAVDRRTKDIAATRAV